MFALFAISTLSFLVLFFAVLALLRRAKAEGAQMTRAMQPASTGTEKARPVYSPGVVVEQPPTISFEASLSALVPDKQPDWRFMVRERRGPGHASNAVPLHESTEKASRTADLRSDRQYFKEDMGDLSDPYQPARPAEIRRAG